MKQLSNEQIEVAVTRLDCMMKSRDMTQQQLAEFSRVSQSAISKFLHRDATPNTEQLTKLFQGLGLKLEDVLELDAEPDHIFGYLATPLTGVVSDQRKEMELRSVVERIKQAAADPEFGTPPFDIYWPGDYTHPTKNPDVSSETVYLTDRSRASTNDFVIMFCGDPSFGVGQENEIASQAGISVIRLIPERISRMMTGSFANARNIRYTGTLESRIQFDLSALREELRSVRLTYYHHRTLYRTLNGHGFGERLKRLIDQRAGDFKRFAEDLGVSLSYIHALVSEQLPVSNPSTRLLKRMAARLDTTIGYLLGENPESDPIWIDSHNTLRTWVEKNPELSAAAVFTVRDEWREQYRLARQHVSSVSSFRGKLPVAMTEIQWDQRYKGHAKTAKGKGSGSLFPA